MLPKRTCRFMVVWAVLAILLTGCGGNGSNADQLIGDWEYKEPTSGMIVTLTITRDKLSFSAVGLGADSVDYTYVDSDTLKVKGVNGEEGEINYTLKGDVLTINFEDADEVEKREYIKVK